MKNIWRILKKHSSLDLARKLARVLAYHLFLEAHSFPRATLSEAGFSSLCHFCFLFYPQTFEHCITVTNQQRYLELTILQILVRTGLHFGAQSGKRPRTTIKSSVNSEWEGKGSEYITEWTCIFFCCIFFSYCAQNLLQSFLLSAHLVTWCTKTEGKPDPYAYM